MPGISGREVAEEARKTFAELRVILHEALHTNALSRYDCKGLPINLSKSHSRRLAMVRKVRSILDQTWLRACNPSSIASKTSSYGLCRPSRRFVTKTESFLSRDGDTEKEDIDRRIRINCCGI